MSEYVEIVNWDATRRHYATQAYVEMMHEGDIPGLCGRVYGCTLEKDRELRMRHIAPARDYAALPLCKFCERKTADG